MLRHPPVNNQRSVALFLQRGYFDHFVARLTGILIDEPLIPEGIERIARAVPEAAQCGSRAGERVNGRGE